MPALDQDHHIVRHALEKDGWTITHDPLTLTVGQDNCTDGPVLLRCSG